MASTRVLVHAKLGNIGQTRMYNFGLNSGDDNDYHFSDEFEAADDLDVNVHDDDDDDHNRVSLGLCM